jgi:hypothetical protein
MARVVTPAELDRAVNAEVRRIQTADGMARLARQRAASRCRSWVDRDGMWCLSARFDPETGLRLDGRLTATIDALFSEGTPDVCPSDPLERQGFLRAQALESFIEGSGPNRAGRADVVVVVDATTLAADRGPTVDWGLPVELPVEVLHEIFVAAEISPIVLCNGAVIHAPGQLDLGRTTRLANRAQRRALRALYSTCPMPGCAVRFAHCTIHHVRKWEDDGPTDLANLLPLCSRHHHAVHDRRWLLALESDRTLRITYPDGTTEAIAPPRRGSPHGHSPKPAPTTAVPSVGWLGDTPRRE